MPTGITTLREAFPFLPVSWLREVENIVSLQVSQDQSCLVLLHQTPMQLACYQHQLHHKSNPAAWKALPMVPCTSWDVECCAGKIGLIAHPDEEASLSLRNQSCPERTRDFLSSRLILAQTPRHSGTLKRRLKPRPLDLISLLPDAVCTTCRARQRPPPQVADLLPSTPTDSRTDSTSSFPSQLLGWWAVMETMVLYAAQRSLAWPAMNRKLGKRRKRREKSYVQHHCERRPKN